MLHGHGDDGYLYQKQILADFSTNVWYGGEPAGLKEHLFSKWRGINKYPEVVAEGLIEKLSKHHELPSDLFLINNGSTESIYLVAQAFKERRTTITVPAFAEYEDACKLYEHEISFLRWDELKDDLKPNAEIIFICNPNNPTGYTFGGLETVIRANPNVLFVIDEAFIEFTLAINSLITFVGQFENLIILRSLTKAYAIPGLRLGYIVASKEIIKKLKSLKYPWSVNTLAIEAGRFIFDNYESIQIPLHQLLEEKERFSGQLRTTGIKVYESSTHFFIAETPKFSAADLKRFLIDNFGILIRDASNFKTLGEEHFRLATLEADKNELLIKAMKEWMSSGC
ncbi:pyridoxal phosphate-dependent aminotransferase [Desertivirga brevis]|uniref:pyridoxal phosphate-dependent aminotransferase n=1 Tax=Desertivirga brevis TaxID=2810310 RepID=UPI001A972EEC|nr:aminotransferase class I/II-fold pyridoxal phosphate-dependent enzyme [Pedobacter sp. SYSU D00873]